ncbi:hypothetical protein [Nocardioides antri]|uniref:Uncharacterized protein n=1 Tax=Nocardioides antri TaxID=2607659 RepID=A0A5B1M119_9ACTN|nr:hypothetical protein [Nocardioides antri]KAA1426454.1 hypothetical protein F0U47_13705 [Nocardioides antri]
MNESPDQKPARTPEQGIERAARALANARVTNAQLTPREQAEAAWHKGCRYSVDELEDRIRARRGWPPLER